MMAVVLMINGQDIISKLLVSYFALQFLYIWSILNLLKMHSHPSKFDTTKRLSK